MKRLLIGILLLSLSAPSFAGVQEDLDSLGPCKPKVIQLMLKYNIITEEQAEQLR